LLFRSFCCKYYCIKLQVSIDLAKRLWVWITYVYIYIYIWYSIVLASGRKYEARSPFFYIFLK
jgi:hypothetical protein